jgi:polyferredoxin
MRIIEDLIFTLWFWGISVLLQMILGSLVRCKITCPVRVPGVHKVIFAYTIK